MFTASEANVAHSHRRVIHRSLGYDFALLGLPVSEARVEVIREAASQTAVRIQQAAEGDQHETDLMLADLASSTYRLLDPRRRTKMIERVQLSIYSEKDLELQKQSRRPLLANPELVQAELVTLEKNRPFPVNRPKTAFGHDSRQCRIGTITLALAVCLTAAVVFMHCFVR